MQDVGFELRSPSGTATPLRFKFTLHVRQCLRLDQKTLSFVTAPASTEADDDSEPRVFRLDPPRQQRIALRQELKIIETDASQANGAGIFHHQEITAAAQRWHVQSLFNGWITTSSGARLASSIRRSRFFSESFGETQWVRYRASIAGSPLRLKRRVWRCGVRAPSSAWFGDKPRSPSRRSTVSE